jgi:hypothetical protein
VSTDAATNDGARRAHGTRFDGRRRIGRSTDATHNASSEMIGIAGDDRHRRALARAATVDRLRGLT